MRQPTSLALSLSLIVVGVAIAYGMLYSHPDPQMVWRAMQPWQRLVVVAGYIMSAWGLGGAVNWLLVKARGGPTN